MVAYVKLRQAGMLPDKVCLTHACCDAAHWFQNVGNCTLLHALYSTLSTEIFQCQNKFVQLHKQKGLEQAMATSKA